MWHEGMPAEYRNSIVTGDAKELARAIPDNSIDLIFTDPIYDRIEDYAWLAETAARVLKQDSACLAFCGIGYLPQTTAALASALTFRWQLILAMPYRNGGHIPGGFSQYIACLWYEKGRSKTIRQVPDMRLWRPNEGPFEWAKNPDFIAYYLEALTVPGAVVWEPFAGAGTIPAVCTTTGRNYVASEIDPATAERARLRVEQTQAMHPVLLGVQEPMELAV